MKAESYCIMQFIYICYFGFSCAREGQKEENIMKSLQLKERLWWNGVLDPELRVFDIVMMTKYGTTYNSYVLKGSEKTALFETNKLRCWDDFKAALDEVVDVKDIDYIIMDHTEPDHAGTIEKLLELNPKITVVATATAHNFLSEIINKDYTALKVGENDTLSLGDKTLHFMVLPNLHWPDTMYTYCEEDKVLFTCDSFGSHYSEPGILRSAVKDEEGYLDATKYYFDNIIGPFANPYMVNALKRIKDLPIDMICTGHGPVHDCKLDQIFSRYREWCGVDENLNPLKAPAPKKLVVIPYVSAYGYTAELADIIGGAVEDAGEGKIEVRKYDMVTADQATVLGDIGACDGVMFGTPTIVGEALAPIWGLVTSMFAPVHKGKLATAFGSYGWSGEGVPHIMERLRQLKLRVEDDGFRVRFKPSEVQKLDAYEFGFRFGCKLLGKKPKGEKKGKGGLVKCLVCGAIFDPEAAGGSCPVCGVGPEKWVEAQDTSTTFRKDTDESFLIVGGGPAAIYAAQAIRERNTTANIGIISEEHELPYNRPMLTKALLSEMDDDQLAIEGKDWFTENNILINYDTVTSIDTETKTVSCGSKTYSYDKLIYATGAHCFVPPIKGADQDHVISIRNIADAKKVQSKLDSVKEAVVIGGGVMGLEAGWELCKAGIDVTILEGAPGLLPKQLDDTGSTMLEDIVNGVGMHVVTSAQTAEITADSVKLSDGREFPAQLVIMSTGMRPNTKLAEDAGIYVDKFVATDLRMRTNVDDVYAVGDCCMVNGAPQAFFAQAQENGRIAGANAAGEELEYDPLGASLAINAMNTSIFALGANGKDLTKDYKTVEIKDDKRKTYEKYYFNNGALVGVILIGDTSKMAVMTDNIANGASFSEVFDL